ncbi:DUF6350 family protein [Cryobacterium frigoriphilum]|uniref:cell division protein PerM n=1 Tax=Cryobacterium frigoriphilum TaxID=1259150 RepID=UPI001580478D|nr:DUF6350 family protein [Cryobacterium frigoriphilum]
MNRITTALLAALEALLVVAIGIGIALVPLTVLWAAHFGLAVEWFVFWRAAVDIWLIGNGVDLLVQLDPEIALAFAFAGADTPFLLTLAPLGFALTAVLLGVRTGRRAAETPHRWVGVAASVLSYALFASLATVSAQTAMVSPILWQGFVLPPLIYAAGVLLGSELGAREGRGLPGATGIVQLDPVARSIRERYLALPQTARTVVIAVLRGGTATTAGIMGVAAIAVAVLVGLNYTTIIGLYEAVQAGVLGGATLTLMQLALIPNFVTWAAAWFVGPGVAVGVGSSVSPAGTVLGPIPGLPILGALPQGTLEWGFLGLLVPILIGFVAAVISRQRMRQPGIPDPGRLAQVLAGVGIGLLAGLLLGLLAWWSGGAIGPGRLTEVGPNPLLVGALAAAEVGVAAVLGMLVGGHVVLPQRRARPATRPRTTASGTQAAASAARRRWPRLGRRRSQAGGAQSADVKPARTGQAKPKPKPKPVRAPKAAATGTRRERLSRFLRAEEDDDTGPDSGPGTDRSGPPPAKR